MLDTADVRKQLTHRLAELRKAQTQRRIANDKARAAFESLLEKEIAPTVRQFAQALKAEGHAFSVQTPAGAVRLVADRNAENVIEIVLEAGSVPAVVLRTSVTRGRRQFDDERTIAAGEAIEAIDASQVLSALLDAIEPFVER